MCQHHPTEENRAQKRIECMLCWHELLLERFLWGPQRSKAMRLDVVSVLKLIKHSHMV